MKRVPLKNIKPGTILLSENQEIYIYLGYYNGHPQSFYTRPHEGYLYMFHSSATSFYDEYGTIDKENIDALTADIIENIHGRSTFGIDGNACYTKSPKAFKEIIAHVPEKYTKKIKIPYIYGLTRLGDKKPRK